MNCQFGITSALDVNYVSFVNGIHLYLSYAALFKGNFLNQVLASD